MSQNEKSFKDLVYWFQISNQNYNVKAIYFVQCLAKRMKRHLAKQKSAYVKKRWNVKQIKLVFFKTKKHSILEFRSTRIINKRSCPFVYIEMGTPNNAFKAHAMWRGEFYFCG